MSEVGNVYLPQEDGGLLVDFVRDGMPIEEAKLRVFNVDIKSIAECDVLVIVLDGRSVDEGASFELGYAFGMGKTCVGLKTDVRTLLAFGDNPMIEGALQRIFKDEEELLDWLRSWDRRI
jgi:nucleoside 2-deoxyribosyltransferase